MRIMSAWLDKILPVEIPLGELIAEDPGIAVHVRNCAQCAGMPGDLAAVEILSAMATRQIANLVRSPIGAAAADTQDTTAFKAGLAHGLLIARVLGKQCKDYVGQTKEEMP